MAEFPRFVSRQLARFFSAEKLFRSETPVFLPFYHTVSNEALPHIQNYPYPDEKRFEAELDYLLRYFKPVSLDELYNDPFTREKVFHLTFDDGLRECAGMIAPILLRKGIPATFFVNSGFAGNKMLFHRYKASLLLSELEANPDSETEGFLRKNGLGGRDILKAGIEQSEILDEAAELLELDFDAFLHDRRPYLSKSEIKNLHAKGFSIGAHSHTHPEFWTMKKKDQVREIVKSMNWINQQVAPAIKAFAFPYTDHGVKAKLIRKLKEEGICDITFGTAGLKYDSVKSHFQRVPMEKASLAEQHLKAEFMYFRLRKLLGKDTVKH